MMDWNDGGWGWGAWLMMGVLLLVFWGLVAWVVVTLVRGSSPSRRPKRSAEEVLAERYARGEIDKDEFTERRDALRSMR
jgi:putative membrane protein